MWFTCMRTHRLAQEYGRTAILNGAVPPCFLSCFLPCVLPCSMFDYCIFDVFNDK